jgi:hypothetical protein
MAKITTFVYGWIAVYTVGMRRFASALNAPEPKSQYVRTISLLLAGIFTAFAFSQLYSFDEFTEIVASYGLFGGADTAEVFAAVIVVLEVFALPFLLRMRLSRLMRVMSMGCGWLVVFVWALISKWLVLFTSGQENVGFLGGVAQLSPGWWAVFVSVALGILSAWASWGMWPVAKKKRLPASK